MDMKIPLGRPNDKPEDPFADMDSTFVPMNEGKSMSLGQASTKGPLESESEVVSDNEASNTSGPTDIITPPGGNPMTDISSYQPLSDDMQHSAEGGKKYVGSSNLGKIIKGDSSQLENYGI